MKSRLLLTAVCLALAGCGVSKDLYRDQVVRSQELEAKRAELQTRLDSEIAGREALEKAQASCQADLEKARGRAGDLDARLGSCSNREADVRADLDICRKSQTAAQAKLASGQAGWEQQRADLERQVENCRGETSNLEARVSVLAEEKERTEREKQEKIDEISKTYDGFLKGMKEEVEKGRVTISQLRGKLTVNLLDEILFDSGSASIKKEGRDVLKHLGDALKGVQDKAIVIEGHTDDVPISAELAKQYPTNWELSAARATSVVRYLQEEAGVDPARLSAVGFGPYRPVASNDAPEGRARNRRIEVKLVPLEAPVFGVSETSPPPAKEGSGEGRSTP